MHLPSQRKLEAIFENAAKHGWKAERLIGCALIVIIVAPFLSYISSAALLDTHALTIYSSGKLNYPLDLPLHVEGNKIKNADGNIVYLRGVNKPMFEDDPDGVWNGNTIWTDANVKAELNAIKSLGANVIRCHQAIEHWINNMGPDKYSALNHKEAIKRLLTFAAERGLYVIYDAYCVVDYWNGGRAENLPYPPWAVSPNTSLVIPNEQAFVDYWADVANTLKGYNNVIFELWNEPNADLAGFTGWFVVAQNCINAIRATGATNLIVFANRVDCWVNLDYPSSEFGSSGSMKMILDYPLSDPTGNLVYCTHIYRDGGSYHRSVPTYTLAYTMEDIRTAFEWFKLTEVAALYPVIISEIGMNNWFTDTALQEETLGYQNLLALCNEMGLSYVGWVWRSGIKYPLITNPTTYTLTSAGEILKAAIATGS